VILVGEMRDLETIRLALSGGGNGPPGVRPRLHTSSAAKTHRPASSTYFRLPRRTIIRAR